MIIDFTYPTIVGNEWKTKITKTDRKGNLFVMAYKSPDKESVFDIYKLVQEIYQKQK